MFSLTKKEDTPQSTMVLQQTSCIVTTVVSSFQPVFHTKLAPLRSFT